MSPHEKRRRLRTGAGDLQMLRPVRGKVVDVSGLGLGIESGDGLEVRQEYNFLLRHGLQLKKLRGRVKWCSLGPSSHSDPNAPPLVFRAGIAIEDLRPRVWTFLSSSLHASHRSEK